MYAFDKSGYVSVRTITGLYGIFSHDGRWIFPPADKPLCPMPLAKDRFIDYYDGKLAIVNELGEKISQGDISANLYMALEAQPLDFMVIDGWFRVPRRINGWAEAKEWTFMDTDGNWVWDKDVHFDKIEDIGFVDGKCSVTKGKETFYIDKTGKRI